MAKKKNGVPLFDIVLTCRPASMRVTDRAVGAFIRNLAAKQMARPIAEAIADEWFEVYCEAWVASHEIFASGGYDDTVPAFKELVVRGGKQPVAVATGQGEQQVTFFLEIRGTPFETPHGEFCVRFQNNFLCPPLVFRRPHTELPPHREVPEDEQPKEKKYRERGPGLAGTHVEEF
jgi:hypothetical protein